MSPPTPNWRAKLRRALVPQSLRRQLLLSVAAMALLIAAGGLTAVYALRLAAISTQHLAEERLRHMQQAQSLVQRTLLLERLTLMLSAAATPADRRSGLADIGEQLVMFDRLADDLAASEHDAIVLELRQSSQLFRNTVNVVAQLSDGDNPHREMPRRSTDRAASDAMQALTGELRRQAAGMAAAAQHQADHYTEDYRQAILELADESSRNERRVTVLLAASLLLSWLIAQRFLAGHLFARLQTISRSLRRGDASAASTSVPVSGNDEIAEMARAVEQFQEDRRKLAQRTAQLEAANEELQELSYAISHEMRTPLRALDGFSHMLQEKHADAFDEESRRMLQVLRDNAQYQGRLVDDILRFLALGRQKLDYRANDIGAMATEIFTEFRAAAPERNLRLEIVGSLPMAWGDRSMLRQVLRNLLTNAIHFTPAERDAVIEIAATAGDGEDVFHVRDHGLGFDMRYAHKLFRVFERVHSKGDHGGTGMGLAIVKRIVDRHGGRVWAEGREGEGATFHFALPKEADATAQRP
jgi:two-component system NtrC family sensor kinase